MFRISIAGLGAAVLAVLLSSVPPLAHEGHDHDSAPPPASATIAARGEATSEAFELVAIAEKGELAIYLDRFATNEPVGGATIDVETPNGPISAVARTGDSYRIPAPWLGKSGQYDLVFTVTDAAIADVLPLTLEIPEPREARLFGMPTETGRVDQLVPLLGSLLAGLAIGALVTGFARRRSISSAMVFILFAMVSSYAHEGEDHGSPAAPPPIGQSDLAQRLPDGSVFVPKSTQRILAIRTALTEEGRFRRTVELPGRVIPDPNASGYVQTSVGGRLSPPPGGFPRLGTRVTKGDVLAYVTPPIQAVDVSDMRQKQGELDQQIMIVERRVGRFEPLAQSGAVSRVQLDETRLELQGLKDRRAALDRARREPEALVAPVDGVVAEGTVVAGQMAQPNIVVFQIVDPARLWIEALSFDALAGAQTATARAPNGKSLTLSFQGSGFADRNQSIPIHYAIEGDAGGMRVGQFVIVLASTGEEQSGLAVPRTSVVRSANGQDVVYEHVTAERFQARAVRVTPLDGERVLIATGLGPGKRVVTQGAELLDQVR